MRRLGPPYCGFPGDYVFRPLRHAPPDRRQVRMFPYDRRAPFPARKHLFPLRSSNNEVGSKAKMIRGSFGCQSPREGVQYSTTRNILSNSRTGGSLGCARMDPRIGRFCETEFQRFPRLYDARLGGKTYSQTLTHAEPSINLTRLPFESRNPWLADGFQFLSV